MKCPKCGCENCQIINNVGTVGKDYSLGQGCCGTICLGPIGLLCGLCGQNKQIVNTQFWVCSDCGNKWKL